MGVTMGNELFLLIVSLSISGTITGLLLLLIKPLTNRFFSKRWHYYIWLVVLIRLIVPISGSWNLVNQFFISDRTAETKIETNKSENVSPDTVPKYQISKEEPFENSLSSQQSDIEKEASDSFASDTNISEKDSNMEQKTTENRQETEPQIKEITLKTVVQRFVSFVMPYLWLFWIFGMSLFLAVKLADYRSFIRYLKANNKKIENESVLAALDDILMDLHIKKEIQFYQNDLMISPMLLGFFRPMIILPSNYLNEIQWKSILMHELIHYKHKDIWYKWFCQLICCIHWFNPFLILFYREINKACELACDEAVIQKLAPEERKNYGNTLINAAERGIQYKNSILTMTLLEQKKNLKERLKHIMNYKKISKFTAACSILVAGIFVAGAVAVGAKTGSNEQMQEASFISPVYAMNQIKKNPVLDILSEKENWWEDSWSDSFWWDESWWDNSYWNSSSWKEEMKEKTKKAETVYDDNTKIAESDYSGSMNMTSCVWNKNYVSAKNLKTTGSRTQVIYDVKVPCSVELTYSITMNAGKFKIVSIGPDNQVTTLVECSETNTKQALNTITVPLKKGKNRIKFVAYHADLALYYSATEVDKTKVNGVYYSEWEENAAKLIAEVKADGKINIEKLISYAPDLDDEELSKCLVELLKTGKKFSTSEWKKLAPFADEDILSAYFKEQLKQKKTIDFAILEPIIYYLDEEFLAEYLCNDLEYNHKLTENQRNKIYPFADEEIIGEYLLKHYADEIGKQVDFKSLLPYLDEEVISEAILNLLKTKKEKGMELLNEALYYLDESDIYDCLKEAAKQKIKLTKKELNQYYLFMDEEDFIDLIGEFY